MKRLYCFLAGVILIGSLSAQPQNMYFGSNITGNLKLTATTNLRQQAQFAQVALGGLRTLGASVAEKPKTIPLLHPPHLQRFSILGAASVPNLQALAVGPSASFGFGGLTQIDQRNANHGNQFSVEPPSQGLAVANGFILEGVNNAVQVYTTSGTPLLSMPLSTNQVFGVSAAIDRSTGVNGVFPTDIRVHHDQTLKRWFILQRSQDNDAAGNPLPSSHLYIAVSQTDNPTESYNVYTMDTTNIGTPGCPCIADFPEIGADQYGIYISANNFNTGFGFVNAGIWAISKASLAANSPTPTVVQFLIPLNSGYEFAIQPATTPIGASYFLGVGGLEYFVSSQAAFSSDSNLAIWAMTNTSSLGNSSPSLALIQTTVPTLSYSSPDVAVQRPGPIPYGASLTPPGVLELLDGGDTRVESVTYSGGRLWVTLATQVMDNVGHRVTGAAYIVMLPTYRSGILAAPVSRQGYLVVNNNHLLRPAVAVNSRGTGAIVFTLVGPDYFPSAAFVPINTTSTGSTIQISGVGGRPEDGFSGYFANGGQGVARWGDYSAAAVDEAGSIWMGTEYIPGTMWTPTPLANWGTWIINFTNQ